MKTVFWTVVGAGILLVVLSLGYFEPPTNPNVTVEELERWYATMAIVSGILGVGMGVLMGWLSDRVVQPKSGESSAAYNSRVALFGVFALVFTVLVELIVVSVSARTQATWQLSPDERMRLAMLTGHAFMLPATAVIGAAVAFVATTRTRVWGGRYALLPF